MNIGLPGIGLWRLAIYWGCDYIYNSVVVGGLRCSEVQLEVGLAGYVCVFGTFLEA